MEPADKLVDGAGAILLGGVSQMCIACGGGGAGMTEQRLDMAQTQALFEQMRGEGMAQGVNGGFFYPNVA